MRPFLFVGLALCTGGHLGAAAAQFASGPNRVGLIELFTSEGCSSCPPAERWLATLRAEPGLWRDFVPVAFHVDYWNRLGWPDCFSTREFTQREYDYAAAWASPSVYTPCVVRDGAEWAGSRSLVPSGDPVGKLMIRYDGAVVHAEFSPVVALAGGTFEIHAAILGGGITSPVSAGENRGETLRHEFIALKMAHAPLGQEFALPVPNVAGVTRHALAVWVTRSGELPPLQATGGWLD
jgi:hypothetical protein